MKISSINQIANIYKPVLNKVAPQPRIINGLITDTFTKSSTTSNPIKPNTTTPSFTGFGEGFSFNKTFQKLPYEQKLKVCEEQERLQKMYTSRKNEHVTTTFNKSDYSPNNEFEITAYAGGLTHSVYLDKEMNRIGEQKLYYYEKNDKVYRIKKAIDYRNNTTTKVRAEVPKNNGNPEVTDEVRIVRDKDKNIVRKEMMTHSEVTGAYDHKYVYPDGTEKVITTARRFKENGKDVIHKDMTSLDGTRTQYNLEFDQNGNKKLEYKITDKKGNVLMNLNRSMERLSENKVRTTNGDKVYDVTFEPDKFTIQEKGKDAVVVPLLDNRKDGEGVVIEGDKSKMVGLLQKLPADQLLAIHNTVRTIAECSGNQSSYMPALKRIKTINETFTILHETGHAIDFRNSSPFKRNASINNDKDLQKIFNKEKKAFNNAYPDAQRNHIDYFLRGKQGNLVEVVAETNALRDSYTQEMDLAKRNQYLQQFFPRTIAYINDKLENYNS